jgi:uncharacterized protein (TIGR03067 family)
MAFKAAVAVLFAVAVPVPPERPDESKSSENLQGEWVLVRATFGKNAPPKDISQTKFVFEGNQIQIWDGPAGAKQENATFSVDVSRKPYAIDIRPKVGAGPGNEIVVRGIFQIKGSTLELTFFPRGGDRPTSFTAAQGSDAVALVFQRAAKK